MPSKPLNDWKFFDPKVSILGRFKKNPQHEKQERINQTRKRVKSMVRKINILLAFYMELRRYSVSNSKKRKLDSQQLRRGLLPIHPEDFLKSAWDILMIITLIIVAIYTPIRVCFIDTVNTAATIIDWSLDGIFSNLYIICLVCDILLTFLTAFYDKNHQLQTNYQTIGHNYVVGWFFIDLISVIPFDSIGSATNGNSSYNRLFRLLRIPRLYSLVRFLKISQQKKHNVEKNEDSEISRFLDSIQINFLVKSLLQIFLAWLISQHIAACFWQYIDRLDNFPENGWVYRLKISRTFTTLYITSFYWATTTITSIGYGEIQAVNSYEYTLACIWLLIAMAFYSIIIGNLASTMRQSDSNQSFFEIDQKFKSLQSKFYFPIELIEQMNLFMVLNLHNNPLWIMNQQEWKENLHEAILREVDINCLKELVRTIPFFNIDLNFTFLILNSTQFLRFKSKELIYRKGDPADEIFFILEGEVHIETQMGTRLLTVPQSTVLGELEVFSRGKINVSHERQYFAVAKQKTTLVVFSMNSFLQALQLCPKLQSYLGILSKKREQDIEVQKQKIITTKLIERERRDQMEQIADTFMPYDMMYKLSPAIKKNQELDIHDNSIIANKKFLASVLNQKKAHKDLIFSRFRRVVKLVIMANRSINPFVVMNITNQMYPPHQSIKINNQQQAILIGQRKPAIPQPLSHMPTTRGSDMLAQAISKDGEEKEAQSPDHKVKSRFKHSRTTSSKDIMFRALSYRGMLVRNKDSPSKERLRRIFRLYGSKKSRLAHLLGSHYNLIKASSSLFKKQPPLNLKEDARVKNQNQLHNLEKLQDKLLESIRITQILDQQQKIMHMQRTQFEKQCTDLADILLKITDINY